MSESDEPDKPDNPAPRDPWAPPAEPEREQPAPPPAPMPADAAPVAAAPADAAPADAEPAPAAQPVGLAKPSPLPPSPGLPEAPTGFALPGADAPAGGPSPAGGPPPVPGPAFPPGPEFGSSAMPPPPPPGSVPYGQPMPYPPYGGYPGYPGYPMSPYGVWPPPTARNGFGTTAMVLGIVGAVLGIACFGAVLGLPLGIAAIVFGIIGLRLANRGEATNRSQALTGLILGIVSSLVSAAMIAFFVTGIMTGFFDGLDEGSGDTISADGGYYDDPLHEGSGATYDDGLVVTVTSVEPTSALEGVTDGGSALTFTVTVVNNGDSTSDLDGSEINAYADSDDDDPLQDMSMDDGFTGDLKPDGTLSTTVVVIVPDTDDGTIQLEIAPGYDYDYAYWEVGA